MIKLTDKNTQNTHRFITLLMDELIKSSKYNNQNQIISRVYQKLWDAYTQLSNDPLTDIIIDISFQNIPKKDLNEINNIVQTFYKKYFIK